MELAAHRPRHVEQVVDEDGLRAGVSLDAIDRPFTRRLIRGGHLHDVHPAEERVQRRAQLVRESREKILFQPIGLLRRAIQHRVVERQPGTRGDILRERKIVLVVLASRKRARREQPKCSPAASERNHLKRTHAEASQQLQVFRSLRAAKCLVRSDVVIHERFA